MTPLEMLIDVLARSRERFDRAFDGVTLEQANTRPDNHHTLAHMRWSEPHRPGHASRRTP